jgi:hypothetical protein
MSLPAELLDLAEHLSTRERTRPRQASLRRSVSTSYYALFHLLTSEAVGIIGPNMSLVGTRKIQRWFEHSDMKRVCGIFSAASATRTITPILGATVSLDLQSIAQAFVRLQEARHEADYDLERSWTRPTAQELVEVARKAFERWARIRRSHEANVFALALLSVKLFDKDR